MTGPSKDELSDDSELETLEGARVGPREHIGPYRLIQRIGEGGMGVVYEAQQEKPVRRRVALKLIKAGMDSKAVIARFESERQALALMNHPNVATVYDGGTSESGNPYFAMEYVPGEPITTYCDKHRLDVARRLELFVQVCNGLQHAHQKGLIHRDIKPQNVLVALQDGVPVAKLIDFGVAKATTQRLTEATAYTELGQIIGTPEYMSPEQAEMTGLDVDTRTDVYSLGVLLYELLVGAQPFDSKELRKAGFDELRRRIREVDPPTPSTRLDTLATSGEVAERRHMDRVSLKEALKGDLDWIVMKAIAKDRTRRYATVSELAKDIERHRNDEPVEAGPPSTMYRLSKFLRRHRVAVTGGALAAAALVLGIAGTTVGLVRARRAERLATAEAAKASAINEFLQETLGSPNPLAGRGRDVTVLEALSEAVDRIDESFADQPEVEAAVRLTIATTYSRLGRYDEARPLAERALSIRRRVLGDAHRDTLEAETLLGLVESHLGDDDGAERLWREALAGYRELYPDDPKVGEVLLNLAQILVTQGRFDEAESLLREAMELWRVEDDRLAVAWAETNLAGVLARERRYAEAEALVRRSLATRRELLAEDHPLVAASLHTLALVLSHQLGDDLENGDCHAALPFFEESLAISEQAYGPSDVLRAIRRSYAECLTELGRAGEAEALMAPDREGS